MMTHIVGRAGAVEHLHEVDRSSGWRDNSGGGVQADVVSQPVLPVLDLARQTRVAQRCCHQQHQQRRCRRREHLVQLHFRFGENSGFLAKVGGWFSATDGTRTPVAPFSLSLTLSLALTHTTAHAQKNRLPIILSFSLIQKHAHTHTHTHTCPHLHTHSPTFSLPYKIPLATFLPTLPPPGIYSLAHSNHNLTVSQISLSLH